MSLCCLVDLSGRVVLILLDYVSRVPLCSRLRSILEKQKEWEEIYTILSEFTGFTFKYLSVQPVFMTYGSLILGEMKKHLQTTAQSLKMTKCMWEDSTCSLATDQWFSSLRECRLIAFEFVPDNPRSLKHLCRLEIRKHMTIKRLCNTVIMDSFPPPIKNYLLYKEYEYDLISTNNLSFLVWYVLSQNITYMYCTLSFCE